MRLRILEPTLQSTALGHLAITVAELRALTARQLASRQWPVATLRGLSIWALFPNGTSSSAYKLKGRFASQDWQCCNMCCNILVNKVCFYISLYIYRMHMRVWAACTQMRCGSCASNTYRAANLTTTQHACIHMRYESKRKDLKRTKQRKVQ